MTFSKNYTFKQITNNSTLSQSLIEEFRGNLNCSTINRNQVTIGNSVFSNETIVCSGASSSMDKYINIGYAKDKNWNHRIITFSITDRRNNELLNYDSINVDYGTTCPTLLDMYQALFD